MGGLRGVRVAFDRSGRDWTLGYFSRHFPIVLDALRQKYGADILRTEAPAGGSGVGGHDEIRVHMWPDVGVSLRYNPNGAFSSLTIFYDSELVGTRSKATDQL
jgi:hypothetical protein